MAGLVYISLPLEPPNLYTIILDNLKLMIFLLFYYPVMEDPVYICNTGKIQTRVNPMCHQAMPHQKFMTLIFMRTSHVMVYKKRTFPMKSMESASKLEGGG